MRNIILLIVLSLAIFSVRMSLAQESPAYGDDFWKLWGDGHAELAAYDLEFPRYGDKRPGLAVSIFVTEDFSYEDRVKADPGRHSEGDVFPVLKLNLVQDFATGIYDYNLMTSSFVAITRRGERPAGSTTKVSFSSQEWCGHVYQQQLFDDAGARYDSHSYFDGEADRSGVLAYPANTMSEDTLWHWARGFAYPALASGESIAIDLLRSSQFARLRHEEVSVVRARLERAAEAQEIQTADGPMAARLATVRVGGELLWSFWIEEGPYRRILEWESGDGHHARLIASERLQYWRLNGVGREDMLAKLGLTARGARVP